MGLFVGIATKNLIPVEGIVEYLILVFWGDPRWGLYELILVLLVLRR